MFRVQAPVIVIPTAEVRTAVGKHLRAAMVDAYRAIARNGEGLEIAHLQFRFRDRVLAVCSRIRTDGFIEIELGLGSLKPKFRRHICWIVNPGGKVLPRAFVDKHGLRHK